MAEMSVRWAWAFVDAPRESFDEALAFWQRVTGSSLSPRRGPQQQFVTLVPEHGDAWLKAQRLDDGPARAHVDLDVDVPLPQALGRAVGLGASVLAELDDVVVCTSPGGLVFCLTSFDPAESAAGQHREGVTSLVDQVCLDIPPSAYATEVAFWTALTGWPLLDVGGCGCGDGAHDGPDSEFARLDVPGDLPLKVLLQRLDTEDGPVRAHLDLAATELTAEVRRHLALGAEHVADGRDWTVLRDPAGALYCVTDRRP